MDNIRYANKNRDNYYSAETKTGKYHAAVRGLRSERAEVWEEYEKEAKSLERFRGSEGYEEKMKEAAEKKDKALEEIRSFYLNAFQNVIDDMTATVDQRKASAPPPDEVAIITSLGQREKVSRDEIEQAGRTITNPLMKARLDEIAKKNGYTGKFYSEVSPDAVRNVIDGLEKNAGALCYMDGKPGESGKRFWEAHQNGENTSKLTRELYIDKDTKTEEETISRFGGIDNTGDFSKIINKEN